MTTLAGYPHVASGKVRDLYAVDGEHLLLVASDRISAYDHVLATPIPDKGRVLTAMSAFWFELLGADGVTHHLAGPPDDPRIPAEVRGRALLVRRLRMLPVECVARGYLAGSGTADYRRTGAVCGIELPSGLLEASQLPEPIFTPATKAELGDHDENVSFEQVAGTVGQRRAEQLRDATLRIYARAAGHAATHGLILADTKFEFGLDPDPDPDAEDGHGDPMLGDPMLGDPVLGDPVLGDPVLGDEVLTPDSSRYWPAEGYAPGSVQPAFDKQYVREWLTSPESGWDRHGDTPPPPLPDEVIAATRDRYIAAYERISGRSFADWLR